MCEAVRWKTGSLYSDQKREDVCLVYTIWAADGPRGDTHCRGRMGGTIGQAVARVRLAPSYAVHITH